MLSKDAHHFSLLKYNQLILSNQKFVLITVKIMSTNVTIALFSCGNLESEEIVTKNKEYLNNLKKMLNSSLIEDRSVIRNLTKEVINETDNVKMQYCVGHKNIFINLFHWIRTLIIVAIWLINLHQ